MAHATVLCRNSILFRSGAVFLVVGATLLVAGCVERRMTVRTDPPGALVEIDGTPIGFSPASMSFTYYAPRKIKITHDDYETLTVIQDVPPPWWDNWLTEFFTENLWPFTLRDERVFHYVLEPRKAHSTESILRRAEEVRQQAHLGDAPYPYSMPDQP